MKNHYEVGKSYYIKKVFNSGYNFPPDEYKLKAIIDSFPVNYIENENELIIAKEQWLEGVEGTKQYGKDIEGNWYFFRFSRNKDNIDNMWVPESVVVDIF